MKDHDPVNHPSHYTSHPSGIECIEVTRHMSFNIGNAMKYLWRADYKNGIEDLKKAIWYIQDEIKRRGEPIQIDSEKYEEVLISSKEPFNPLKQSTEKAKGIYGSNAPRLNKVSTY